MTIDRSRKRTVVVIDENAEYREILIDLLARLPGLCIAASGADAADAVELCRRHQPDFLLLDSGMAGFAALRAAAAVRKITPRTIIVFLTSGDVWKLRAALDVGSTEHVVSKSEIKSELLAMLSDHWGNTA